MTPTKASSAEHQGVVPHHPSSSQPIPKKKSIVAINCQPIIEYGSMVRIASETICIVVTGFSVFTEGASFVVLQYAVFQYRQRIA